jgi:hypothetical protein
VLTLALAGFAVAVSLPASAPEAPLTRLAIVVGANDGGPGREPLRFAQRDAEAMRGVLTQLGAVAPNDALALNDPSPVALAAALRWGRDRIERVHAHSGRALLFFYYSGHSDEVGLLLGPSRHAYRALLAGLAACGADLRVIVLDSCASGAAVRYKGGVRRPPFAIDAGAQVVGQALLTSSSDAEAAQESDALGASFFTHHFLAALRGAADTRAERRVSLSEAYAYAARETLAQTARIGTGAQHATYDIHLTGTGDLIVTDLRDVDGSLALDADLSGRVYVYDLRGRLVTEAAKPARTPTLLGLPRGLYDVVVGDADGLWSSRVQVDRQTPLARVHLHPLRPEMARSRGALALSGAPRERLGSAQRSPWHFGLTVGVARVSALLVGYAPTENVALSLQTSAPAAPPLSLGAEASVVLRPAALRGDVAPDGACYSLYPWHLLAGPALRWRPSERWLLSAGPLLSVHRLAQAARRDIRVGAALQTRAAFEVWRDAEERWLLDVGFAPSFQLGFGNLFLWSVSARWQGA